ncbi:MAG TPA: arylsulfatase [Opitutaceae bacterium]|nr:arylsulfatase [Opitutaceae bacterium]
MKALRALLVFGAMAVTGLQWSVGAEARARPNILLILADDLGYSDIGAFGSEIRTPHLDALAARGVRFTDFYNGTVCCPSRAAMLTGLYAQQAGVGWLVAHGADARPPGPYQGYLNDRCVTVAEVLHDAGYRTLMSGKWHVGESRPHWPVDRGFDHSFALISGAANYFDLSKDYEPHVKRQMAIDDRAYTPPATGFYMTDAIAEHATEFVAQTARDSQPFFLYLAFTAPHFPLHAPAEDIARNRGRYRAGWDALRAARFGRLKQLGIVAKDVALGPRDPDVPPWDQVKDPELEDLKMAIYAAQIERMDAGIGRVLAALRKAGKEENTLIFFTADNGGCASDLSRFREARLNRPPFLGGPESYEAYGRGWANASNTPFRKYKTWLHEGGISGPLIVAGPGVGPANTIRREPLHMIDLMATFVEVARATYPTRRGGYAILPLEGESFASALRGGSWGRRRPLFWEFEGHRAMRDGAWKLLGREGQPWQLYDLARDRGEANDLAAEHPDRVRSMAARVEAWAQRSDVQPWAEVGPTLQNIPGLK